METVYYLDCKEIAYSKAWEEQEALLKANVDLKLSYPRGTNPFSIPTRNYLLFCEHNDVYTLGKSGKREHLLITEEECAEKNIEYYPINRGGDITYHGKGQITGYPIFDLERFKPDIHWYMRMMEECVIRCIADFGLKGGRIEGFSGVWLDVDTNFPRKISAQGVRCSRWITMHGFAFNVNTDLSFYDYIVPCGIEGKGVTSLKNELGYEVDIEMVKEKLKNCFEEVFNCSCESISGLS